MRLLHDPLRYLKDLLGNVEGCGCIIPIALLFGLFMLWGGKQFILLGAVITILSSIFVSFPLCDRVRKFASLQEQVGPLPTTALISLKSISHLREIYEPS